MAHGVLIVDKPVGPTSHAVVSRVRAILGTRAVGHAGTLDPAASGVLVVAIGEATKLTTYLSSHPKRYRATVRFGTATDTLDAQGRVFATERIRDAVKAELRCISDGGPLSGEIAAAIKAERQRTRQVPPAFSAIKTQGVRSYDRARKGEDFELAARDVSAMEIGVVGATEDSIDLSLFVSKGYYVRSLARDLGAALGVPAHLESLRRTASGPFTIDEAVRLSEPAERISSTLMGLGAAAKRILPAAELTDDGARRASHGQLLDASHFVKAPAAGLSAWLTASGDLIAVGKAIDAAHFAVERGFGYAKAAQ